MSNGRGKRSPPAGLTPASRASSNGTGRERVSDIQRARMLAAMIRVVSERGASNVTVADVVARSGVSRRTFYEIFVDREECFLAAFEDALKRTAGVVLPVYGQPGPWRARIRAVLTSLLEFLDDEQDIARLMIVETLAAGPRALERRQSVLAKIIAVVEEGRMEVKRGDGPPPLTAEGIVGGVLSVLYSRLVEEDHGPLLDLTGSLTSMIVLPYLGVPAAQRELGKPTPQPTGRPRSSSTDPLRELHMRLTYRTVRVLTAVAAHPGSSNRQVGQAAGIEDQGQISKLLKRLRKLGLVHNTGIQTGKGTANAWTLTPTGDEVHETIAGQTNDRAGRKVRSHA
jgi:AcrR family transcriptional regulator